MFILKNICTEIVEDLESNEFNGNSEQVAPEKVVGNSVWEKDPSVVALDLNNNKSIKKLLIKFSGATLLASLTVIKGKLLQSSVYERFWV